MKFLNLLSTLLFGVEIIPNFNDLSIHPSECDVWLDLNSGRD